MFLRFQTAFKKVKKKCLDFALCMYIFFKWNETDIFKAYYILGVVNFQSKQGIFTSLHAMFSVCCPWTNNYILHSINRIKNSSYLQPQVIKFISYLPMVRGSLRVLRLRPPLKWSPWYSWNTTESGVKHQKLNQNQIGN